MHAFANPARFLKIAKPLTPWLFWCGWVLLLAGCLSGLFVTPAEALQGELARNLYIHDPPGWLAQSGGIALAIAGLVQLVWRHPLAAIAGRAIAWPGALFTAISLATGSIWGRPAWGTWWEWDGRMTSMLVQLFLYLGYIALANASRGPGQDGGTARVAAIFALVSAVNIPIIKFSVNWWNTLHQKPSITLSGSSIDPSLLWPLGLTLVGFTFLFGGIVLMRMRAILAENKIEARLQRLARG